MYNTNSYNFSCIDSRNTPEYLVWLDMIEKCNNPKHPLYNCFGGAGIKVADDWLHSFDKFIEDMGPAPCKENNAIERICQEQSFNKSNCRWRNYYFYPSVHNLYVKKPPAATNFDELDQGEPSTPCTKYPTGSFSEQLLETLPEPPPAAPPVEQPGRCFRWLKMCKLM